MNLDEHVDWGGSTWTEQVRRGLEWLGPLSGLRMLDLGARYGGMSVLFARLGATVVGIDLDEEPLAMARQRAADAGVSDRVSFEVRSGEPADLPGGFDVAFTKSVLVLAPDLDASLSGLHAALVTGGRLLLVENALGSAPLRVARSLVRRSFRPYGANYFTAAHIDTVRRRFTVDLERWTSLPPTVLIGAMKHQ